MKKVKSENENCITTPSSCVEWNGGSIEYLGICDGDSLNTLMWEVVTKLQDIAGEDLSEFDIDALVDICNLKAPLEVDLLSILNLLKDNQICLKDYITALNEQLNSLFQNTSVTVNLKCYAQFDNLGNSLSITREQLDQLIIDRLCDHKQRIESLEGKVITMQAEIDGIDTTATVDELSYDTCLDPGVDKPTSTNVINLAQAHCDYEEVVGDATAINTALSLVPGYPTEVTTNFYYIPSPANWAEHYQNLMLYISYLQGVVDNLEDCCASDCNDIELGFTAVYNEDKDGILITFSWGAGTIIPAGFGDCGSTGTITDIDGNTYSFNIEISNNSEAEVNVTGLNTLSPLEVKITAKLCDDGLTCQKCLTRTVTSTSCQYCTYTANGSTGTVAITYTTLSELD